MGLYLGSNLVGTGSTHIIEVENTDIEDGLLTGTLTEYSSTINSIGSYAFYQCYSLTTVNLPLVTSIGACAFDYCSALTSINLPLLTSVEGYTFHHCYSLSSISLPQVTSIGSYAFAYCSALASVNLPQVSTIDSYAFSYCNSLSLVNLPRITDIEGWAFKSCPLVSLNLNGVSSIPYLASTAFQTTPLDSTDQPGSIYVPASLYNSFLTATNWSIFSSRIISI